MLLNPTWTTARNPLRIAVASDTKIEATPRLNAAAWIRWPIQSRITYPPATWWGVLDPSKLTLTNPSDSFFHVTQTVFFGLGAGKGGFGGLIECVSWWRMHHLALAFLALINVATDWGSSFQKIALFRVFQMLHKSAATLSSDAWVTCICNLDSQIGTLSNVIGGKVIETQLWYFARRHISCAAGHWRNKCSISSMSTW